jgi:hypothetical protein
VYLRNTVIGSVVNPPARPVLRRFRRQADETIRFDLEGEIGHAYRVEGSPDLRQWSVVMRLQTTQPATAIRLAPALRWAQQFFRAAVEGL